MKQDVLQSGEVSMELASPYPPASGSILLRFTVGGLAWIAQPSRLTVDALADDKDPGEFVAAILGKLQHTPVSAVGNNFHFDPGDRGKDLQTAFACRGWEALGKQDEVLGSETGIKLSRPGDSSRPGGLVGISLQSTPDKVTEVRFNFHREMASAGAAAQAAAAWRNDRKDAHELVKRLMEASA